MKRLSFFILGSIGIYGAALSQTPQMASTTEITASAKTGKPVSQGNPLSAITFCADPTAIEHNGRLFVYGTNDQQAYNKVNGTTEIDYGHVKSLVYFSTEDMVNWTHHGTINMSSICGSWFYASWAPSIVSRIEDDGKTHFYMYFSNAGSVGVVTSTSPLGPWTAPINKRLVDGSTPGLGLCSTPFDPGAAIDTCGVGWLTLGGGSPNAQGTELQPGNARIVRLGKDMVSLDSEIIPISAPYHFEANELNIIGGKYVYTYNTSWRERSDWSKYGSFLAAPTTCSMCYFITDDPLHPEKWTYSGEYFKNPGTFDLGWGNNHTHLQKFAGEYYLFYHTQDLQNTLGLSGGYRSIAVNKATVNEKTGRISIVTANRGGVSQLKKVDPYVTQQAETMCTSGGIGVASFGATGNTIINNIHEGDWLMVKGVNFGTNGAGSFKVRVCGKGKIEIRADKLSGKTIGSIEFETGSKWQEISGTLSSVLKNSHNLYFVFGGEGWLFDSWIFTPAETTNLNLPTIEKESNSTSYDLNGRPTYKSDNGQIIIRDNRKYILNK